MSAREPVTWTDAEREAVARAIATATWVRHRLPASSPCKHCLDAHTAAEAALRTPAVEARVRQAKAEAAREALETAAAYADEHCDFYEPAITIPGGYSGYRLGIGDWLRHRADHLRDATTDDQEATDV